MRNATQNGLPSALCAASHHHRMLVILPLEAFGFWLDCANVDAVNAAALTAPREDFFEAYEISIAVNRVANAGPALLERSPISNPGQVHAHPAGDPRKLR